MKGQGKAGGSHRQERGWWIWHAQGIGDGEGGTDLAGPRPPAAVLELVVHVHPQHLQCPARLALRLLSAYRPAYRPAYLPAHCCQLIYQPLSAPATRSNTKFVPARRAHAAFSAASDSRGLKRPFEHSGCGLLVLLPRVVPCAQRFIWDGEERGRRCEVETREVRGDGRGEIYSTAGRGRAIDLCCFARVRRAEAVL